MVSKKQRVTQKCMGRKGETFDLYSRGDSITEFVLLNVSALNLYFRHPYCISASFFLNLLYSYNLYYCVFSLFCDMVIFIVLCYTEEHFSPMYCMSVHIVE